MMYPYNTEYIFHDDSYWKNLSKKRYFAFNPDHRREFCWWGRSCNGTYPPNRNMHFYANGCPSLDYVYSSIFGIVPAVIV